MAFLVVFVFSMLLGSGAGLFTLENNCSQPIWPVVRPRGENLINLTYDNIHLLPGERVNVPTPPTWFGQVSARTGCSFDQSGIGANCTTGTLPPITVVEFLLSEMQNRYYVSVVDGFNLPVSVVPSGGSGDCQPVGCPNDLNRQCPNSLQVRRNGTVVACQSACLAFKEPKYCCTGQFDSPNSCKPSDYSSYFKHACPKAMTFPQDDPTLVGSCQGTQFLISFC